MLHKTRGIVFRTTEYGESSLVVQIYTEAFGLESYLINSVRKKHPKYHANLFQPLTPVDLIVYHKERQGLQRVSEIKANPLLINIPTDVLKTSIIFFLNEVLRKSIHEEESNQQMFDFIMQSIEWLDHSAQATPDFHLIFMVMLSKYLGFAPAKNYNDDAQVFNLREGYFQSKFPEHANFIAPPISEIFFTLLSANYSTPLNITITDRRKLIDYMLEYYALHIENFGEVKSKKVLEEILGE